MSAPDPKDWWAKPGEIHNAVENCEYGNDRQLRTLLEVVARRRALAELKALVARFDDLWFDGADEAIAVIHDRIAEIEAEG